MWLCGRNGWVQRGRREMVSLYFGTLYLFPCVRIDCQRWYKVHIGGLFSLSLGASRIFVSDIRIERIVDC